MDAISKFWPFVYGIALGAVNFYCVVLMTLFTKDANRLSRFVLKGIKIALIMAVFLATAEIVLISVISRFWQIEPSMIGFILGFGFSYVGNLQKYASQTFDYIVEHFKFD